jgi:hypothetical protein
MPYPFVLSYARKDAKIGVAEPKPDPYFEMFLERLNVRVMQLTGSEIPGFVDTHTIQPGDDWKDDLAEALRTAETMVCLYSPTYFKSEHCGKEMQVLLDRRRDYMRDYGGKPPANIIPVVWHSVTDLIPKTLPAIQYRTSKLDPEKYGAWDLGDQNLVADLQNFADEIAQKVRVAARDTPLPPSEERPVMDEVPNAFVPPFPLPEFDSPDATAGPNAVTFVYATSTDRKKWPWAPPPRREVLYLAAAVAKGKEMKSNQLTFDLKDGSLADRLAALRRKNNVAILLLDAARLNDDDLCACIREYDRLEEELFATIVVGKQEIDPGHRARLKEVLPYFAKRIPPHLSLVEDSAEFDKIIASALDSLKAQALRNSQTTNPVGKSQNLPTVNGPGRLQDAS